MKRLNIRSTIMFVAAMLSMAACDTTDADLRSVDDPCTVPVPADGFVLKSSEPGQADRFGCGCVDPLSESWFMVDCGEIAVGKGCGSCCAAAGGYLPAEGCGTGVPVD